MRQSRLGMALLWALPCLPLTACGGTQTTQERTLYPNQTSTPTTTPQPTTAPPTTTQTATGSPAPAPANGNGNASPTATSPAAATTPAFTGAPRLAGFTSGINVAWVNFAADIGKGNGSYAALGDQFAELSAAGGTVARLWLHVDGTTTPTFDSNGVSGLSDQAVSDLSGILDLAQANGIQLMLTLWSFDMLRSALDPNLIARNRLLLTDGPSLQLYLDNALTKMVTAVHGHPALFAWDVINEPEGMTAGEGWSSTVAPSNDVSTQQIQTLINRIAGRIHKIAPTNRVTVGAVSYKYLSASAGVGNNYSDQALIAAGGDPLGVLDFYEVHYYQSKGDAYSPFLHTASDFGSDKPVMVGEFYMQEYLDHQVAAPHLLYAKLQSQGYVGAMAWKDGQTPAMQLMVNAMTYLQHPGDLGTDPNLCVHFSGGFGTPFFSGTSLYRLQTATAVQSDTTQRCLVE